VEVGVAVGVALGVAMGVAVGVGMGIAVGVAVSVALGVGDGAAVSSPVAVGVAPGLADEPGAMEADPHAATNAAVAMAHANGLAILRGRNRPTRFGFARRDSASGDK
jgi:hypothetical protein